MLRQCGLDSCAEASRIASLRAVGAPLLAAMTDKAPQGLPEDSSAIWIHGVQAGCASLESEMSNQNRKARIRARQRTTKAKYTQAARELDQLEGLASDGPPADRLVGHARKNCSVCGGQIRWVSLPELERLRPDMVREFREFYGGSLSTNAEAWVCLKCDNAGVFGPREVGGHWADLGLTEADLVAARCADCGGDLDWIDPAKVATLDRQKYLDAKNAHGVLAVLEGTASVCCECARAEIHPRV